MASNRHAKWYPSPFSSYSTITDALFWDRRRPRLQASPLKIAWVTCAGEDACGPRRARPLVRLASLKCIA